MSSGRSADTDHIGESSTYNVKKPGYRLSLIRLQRVPIVSAGIVHLYVEGVVMGHCSVCRVKELGTSGSAIAEGPCEALVSRNPATTKHLT